MASALHVPPITIEQYLAFESPDGYRDELLYGKIIVSPDPKPIHLDIAENLYSLLKKALGRKYKVGQRINLRFPAEHSMPSPDVFVMEQKSWNKSAAANDYPDGSQTILAIEILSPGNRSRDMQLKTGLYAAHSVDVWIVDPRREEVKVSSEEQTRTFSLKDIEIPLPSRLGGKSIKIAGIFKLPYHFSGS